MHRLQRAALFAGVCGALLAAPCAVAQTSPDQGTNGPPKQAQAQAAPAYSPTSLEPDDPFATPRTPEGRPDFQGAVWEANFFGPLEAMPALISPHLVLAEDKAKEAHARFVGMFLNNPAMKALVDADPEAVALLTGTNGLPIVRGERRTRLLVLPADGRLPYSPEGRREAAAGSSLAAPKSDNPEQRLPQERCIAMGGQAPMAMMSPLHPRQFIQTASHIVIQTEYGDEVRVIPFAAAHGPAALQRPMGDSVARWEDDTLVVETTSFPPGDRRRGAFPVGLIVNTDSKVTERFTRVGVNELLYQFTVEDPKLYTGPWLAEYSLYRAGYRMYPSSCHEGNYSLPNILSGQRVADARAAQAKP